MENLELNLFNSIYRGKKVLITGHTGFKGSWLSLWLTLLGAEVIGFSLSERTSPSHFDLLKLNVKTWSNNILDLSALRKCLAETKPDIVFHMAAQALVRASYRDSILTYQTNVIGTLNLLEAVKGIESVKGLINITTDKVYDNKEWSWPYRENDALGGYDLYSSSKACVEILTASYRNSFFSINDFGNKHQLLISTARAGNVIGGGDWADDRLIPDAVRATNQGQTVEIRNPQAVRPWEHVLEALSGYLLLGQRLLEGKKQFATAWNFGPHNDQALSVKEVLNTFKNYWPAVKWKVSDGQEDTLHEANILKLDCSKAHAELGWKPVWNLQETLQQTAEWYRTYYASGTLSTTSDLSEYVKNAIQQKVTWTLS